MDYNTLLDMAVELGYRLAMSGAETFRVEDSVNRVMQAYNIKAEVFAIPNCLHVSIETANGEAMTRMRRVGHHGNDLDAVEKYNSVSRKICSEKPAPEVAAQWVKETENTLRQHPFVINLLGNALIACGFAILFGGSFKDSLCAGICGLGAGLVNKFMDRMKVNPFFSIITAAFIMSLVTYFAASIHIIDNQDVAIIGTLMILVPGLLFTNAMRDIIYGDTNSGTNRIVQVFLIAAAIALGTGAALKFSNMLWVNPTAAAIIDHGILLEAIAAFIGSLGFAIIFNVQLPGGLLCAAGGMISWVVYRSIQHIGGDITAYFTAAMASALYAEIMARIRKYPAISYLVASLITLIPGAGVYYTMNYIVQGDIQMAANQGTYTVAIAGALAVGVLLISTVFRLISIHKKTK